MIKRKCIHDENGNIDPVKAAQTPTPRATAPKKRKSSGDAESTPSQKKIKQQHPAAVPLPADFQAEQVPNMQSTMPYEYGASHQPNMVSNMPIQHQQQDHAQLTWQQPYYLDAPDASQSNDIFQYSEEVNMPYSMPSLQQFASEVLDSGYVHGHSEEVIQQYQTTKQALDEQMYPDTQQSYLRDGQDQMMTSLGASVPVKTDESVDSGVSLPENTPPVAQNDQEQSNPDHLLARQQNQFQGITTPVGLPLDLQQTSNVPEAADTLSIVRTHPVERTEPDQYFEDTIVVNTKRPVVRAAALQEAKHVDQVIEASDERPQAANESAMLPAARFHGAEPHVNPPGPVEFSPPSSPLTEAARTPEPVFTADSVNIPRESPRHSSRQTKAVERLTSVPYDQPRERTMKPKTLTSVASILPNNTESTRRKSVTPASTTSRLSAGAEVLQLEQPRQLTAAELEEQESLRLARELQGETFGLRRRL